MLATGQKSPDFKWSGFQMPGTGIRLNLNTARGSVFGGLLYFLSVFMQMVKHKSIPFFILK
jgi:hypothetical protein